MNNTLERVTKVMLRLFDGIEREDIVSNQNLYKDGLDISSLDTVLFFLALEDEFMVELPDNAYSQIDTIGDLVNCIEGCLRS